GYGGSYFEALRELRPDHEWINAGVGGNTVINLLRRLDDDVFSHNPDGVFVMIGGNDAISWAQPKTRSYYQQGQAIPEGIVTPEQFEAGMRDLLTRLNLAQVLVWVALPPAEYNPAIVTTLRDYNARTQAGARALNVPVLDLMAALTPPQIQERPPLDITYILTIGGREKRGWDDYEGARAREGYTFSFDGVHFTPGAAQQVAKLISDFIDT
ncbi:MAG: hypothetical protein GYB67_03255, partial [Chloroflexi bacterium]|nr:hypothetical protein [Chloroflexota bacterium]